MEFVEINGFTVTDGGHNFRRPTCKELATSSRSNQIYFDSRADTKRLTPLEMALLYNEAQGVLASNEFPPAARAMTWGSLSGAVTDSLPYTGIIRVRFEGCVLSRLAPLAINKETLPAAALEIKGIITGKKV